MALRAEAIDRPVPMTYNRAASAIVQSRRHLEKAEAELRLAVEILSTLDDPGVPWPPDPSVRVERLRAMEALVLDMESAVRSLNRVWPVR